MRREHTKNRSWLGWGLLVALAALVVLIMPLGRGGDVAFADPVPAACDANEGTATALISAEATRGGVPVESGEVNPGDIITYTVGAALGETAGIACSVFAIQVHLNTPDGNWLDPAICKIANLAEGATEDCTEQPEYTVTGDEPNWPDLRAIVKVKGDKHDGSTDCTDANNGDPKATAECFGAEATTLLVKKPTEKPNIVKGPRLANLWLCDEGVCDNKEAGVASVNLELRIDGRIPTREPKCLLTAVEPTDCPRQTIGSLEFEVRYDPKYITLSITPSLTDMECFEAQLEGLFQVACVTKGKPTDAPDGDVTIAVLHVEPTADVYKLMIPNQENGIVTQLINQDCQLSDLQGHPIKTDICENAAITIRYLEGDVHNDCMIDVLDQQQVAFRWGAQLGNLLYSPLYDLEPSFPKADGDIDAKDLQFVYGRHTAPTSTCKDPHPEQNPVDPQVKIGALVCESSVTPTGSSGDGQFGSTVTPVLIISEDCSTTAAIKAEHTQNFQGGQPEGDPAGWAGWSCIEAGFPDAIGGGVIPEDGDVFAQGLAEPGAPAVDGNNYPVYPHYTFPSGEEGWVVEAAGTTPPTSTFVLCGP